MKNDPIMAEAYAAKEELAARFGEDMHGLAEYFRRLPPWEIREKPARRIRTAEARLKRLTDPGDVIREVRRAKEQIAAENGYDIHRIVEAINRSSPGGESPLDGRYRKPA